MENIVSRRREEFVQHCLTFGVRADYFGEKQNGVHQESPDSR